GNELNCVIQNSRIKHLNSTQLLLGLGVRSVGDEYCTIGLPSQRLRAADRRNAAGEPPHAGSNQFAVERVDLRFGYGGRVEVVGEGISNQIIRDGFSFSRNGVRAGRLPCLHYIDERPNRNSTTRPRYFAPSAL